MRFFIGKRIGNISVGASFSGSKILKGFAYLILWPFYLLYYGIVLIVAVVKAIIKLIIVLIGKHKSAESEQDNTITDNQVARSMTDDSTNNNLSMTYNILSGNSRKFYLAARNEPYVVLDLETTGLSRANDRIIEISMIRCDSGHITRFETLVNPGIHIPGQITGLTGISDSDVANAPYIDDILDDIYDFIGDKKLVAHNASYDAGFLCHAFSRIGETGTLQFYDTVKLAKKAFPDLPNYKLHTLIEELHLMDGPQTHRAGDDAECTRKLFDLCIARLLEDKEEELAAKRAKRAAQATSYETVSPSVNKPAERRSLDQEVDDILSDLSWLN